MTLELGHQFKVKKIPICFQLNKIDEQQFLRILEVPKDLIETSLPIVKLKPPGTHECKQALDKYVEKISAYTHTSLEFIIS